MTLRQTAVLVLAGLAAAAAAVASLALGAVHVPAGDVIRTLFGGASDPATAEIVNQLRLPRTVEALAVGGALGLAGVLLQGSLANPLASPDIVGITGGAAFGAMAILLAFPDRETLLPLGALLGGSLAGAVVLVIAWSGTGAGGTGKLILAGIAVGAMFGAATTSLMVVFADRVQSAVSWMAGGLSADGWQGIDVVWPYLVAGLAIALLLARPLDRLALGDDVAASLGSRPQLVRLAAMVAATVLASAAAALVGLLGFLGLVIPHMVRLAGGSSRHAYAMVASVLAGAGLLAAGDTLARVVFAPIELPVGPFMVILGVPVFLYLLRSVR